MIDPVNHFPEIFDDATGAESEPERRDDEVILKAR